MVKYGTSGKALWARTLVRGYPYSAFWSAAVDEEGNIYGVGEINGKDLHDFGKGVTVQGSSEKRNPLVVKYDPAGTPQWARSLLSGPGDFQYHTAAIDSRFVYLSGQFVIKPGDETYDFGGGVAVQTEKYEGHMEFLAAFDYSGTAQWVLMPPSKGVGWAEIRSVCPVGEDELIMAGGVSAEGALDLGNGVTVDGTYPSWNLFVARYRHTVSTAAGLLAPSSRCAVPARTRLSA